MDYVLVDDHVGLSWTLANLRGYIETRGGRVIAMTTLTEVEALNLCRQPSVAAIEDFLAQAAVEARGRGPVPTVESPDDSVG